MRIKRPVSFPLICVMVIGITMGALFGCTATPTNYTQQKPGIITETSSISPQPLLTEKAIIRKNQLTIQYFHQGETIHARAEIPRGQGKTQKRGSTSLSLEQAVSENNGLPVVRLSQISDSELDNAMHKMLPLLPVAGVAMWREFRDRLISGVMPVVEGEGIVIEFLKQDELFFYYDEMGVMQSTRLSDKPAGFVVHDTYRFSELMSQGTSILDEYTPATDDTLRGEILFNTGDMSRRGYPFVYANMASGQMVFLQRPIADEDCCEQSKMMLPQALVHTTDSHITGLLKQPVGSVARLFTLVWYRMVDTVTLKPLALLNHKPMLPVGENEPMGSVAWEQELDRLTRSSKSQGRMEYLVDGAAFFSRLFDAIQSATDSIDVRVYIFDNDHYALQIADLLKQRSKEIRVRVLMDGLGSFAAASTSSTHSPAEKGKLPNIIKYLKQDSDIKIRVADNHWLAGDHTKTILIDKKIAFIGGMNLGREYRYDWHDLMVELHGPIVDEVQHQFEKAWRLQSYLGDFRAFFYRKREPVNKPGLDDVPIRLLLSRPGDPQILRAQLAAIARAKQRIYIQNAYFTSDDILYELSKARRRGVDVRVVIPYQSDSGVINRSNVKAMNAMLANGIKVYIYPKESHLKGAVYDGWVCLGSANFDRLSLRVNKELNIATSDPTVVQEFLDKIMYPDFEKSVELTQPLPEKWSDFLMEIIADQL